MKRQHPEAKVLSRRTGHERDYGRNPYVGYDSRRGPFPAFAKNDDDRLPAMERVVALREGKEAVAVPFSALSKRRVVRLELGKKELVVFWARGAGSVLDRARIAKGKEVGVSAVFVARAGDRALTFEPKGEGRFRDRETGTLWNISGKAIEGELVGAELEPVAHGNHFWFAWIAFMPETKILRK